MRLPDEPLVLETTVFEPRPRGGLVRKARGDDCIVIELARFRGVIDDRSGTIWPLLNALGGQSSFRSLQRLDPGVASTIVNESLATEALGSLLALMSR
jgi:hypothetical protein